MAAMTDYLENKLIDHIFRGVSFSAPTALWIGLMTTAPSDTGPGTEVSTSGTNYGRVNLAPSTANWAATNGATTTTNPSSGNTGTTSNNSAINFLTPGATGWGTVTHFGIWDAQTSGNMLFYGQLTASKTVNSGDPAPSFAISALSVQLDN